MGRGRATASPDHIDPPLVNKPLKLCGNHLGSFIVVSLFIWQASVRHTQDRKARELSESADVVSHEVWTGRAIQPDRKQIVMRKRDIQGLYSLSGQHRSHRFNSAGGNDGDTLS